jgi:hypothetical protein
MSVILTTGSSIKSTNQPAALLEACLFLDGAEKARNGANPGIAPKNNISITISSDDGVAQVTATLPVEVTVLADGGVKYAAKNYLGGVYALFTPGGDVTADTRMEAVVQIASILSASEKLVQPLEDQPNNVQVESSSEAGTITVTATLPISTSIGTTGEVEIIAIDYL